jgi:hypothetical protein
MPEKGLVPALFVASGPEDIPGHPEQWFECGNHEPTDNLAGVERVSLEPIDELFAKVFADDPIALDLARNYHWDDAVGCYVHDD